MPKPFPQGIGRIFMNGKELLEKVLSTPYAHSTHVKIFCAAQMDELRADKLAQLIDKKLPEQEMLEEIKKIEAENQ